MTRPGVEGADWSTDRPGEVSGTTAAAITACGHAPGEIFFTDDRPENVDGARRAGLDATLFRGAQPLLRDLLDRQVALNI